MTEPMLIEMGVGWVPTPGKPHNVTTATPGQYVAEIQRLRGEISHLESLLDPVPEAVAAWVEVLNDERDREIAKLRAERKKLDRRIHNQRRQLRETWEIVEMRRKWLGSDTARRTNARLRARIRELTDERATSTLVPHHGEKP